MACSEVSFGTNHLSIHLGGDTADTTDPILLSFKNLFKDGIILDPLSTNKYCYAAFGSNKLNIVSTSLILGNIYFESYYTVFDMSATVGDNYAKNKIGYGKINPRNVLGDRIYNSDDAHFERKFYD